MGAIVYAWAGVWCAALELQVASAIISFKYLAAGNKITGFRHSFLAEQQHLVALAAEGPAKV